MQRISIMGILIKNKKDALEAYLSLNGMLVHSDCYEYDPTNKIFLIIFDSEKRTLLSVSGVVRCINVARILRIDISSIYLFMCLLTSIPIEHQSPGLRFAYLGILLLAIPITLAALALVLPVALVSHPITYLINKIGKNEETPESEYEKIDIRELVEKTLGISTYYYDLDVLLRKYHSCLEENTPDPSKTNTEIHAATSEKENCHVNDSGLNK